MHENSIDSSDSEIQIFKDYENFKKKYEPDIQKAMKEAMLESEYEEKVYKLLYFLHLFPKLLTTGKKKQDENDVTTQEKTTKEYFLYIIKKYKNGRKEPNLKIKKEPEIGGTIPDQMVRLILKKSEKCTEEKAKAHINSHILAMSAENLLGSLLERYIAGVIESHGWIWCCSEIILATDFIKFPTPPQENTPPEKRWICLQVKNGDNTENSSSSKIREPLKTKDYKDKIKSELWFRSYSKWRLKLKTLKEKIYEKLEITGMDEKDKEEKLKEHLKLKSIEVKGKYNRVDTWIDLAGQLGFNDLVNPPDKRNTNWDKLNEIIGLSDDGMSEEKLEQYISDLYKKDDKENHEQGT